MVFIVSEEQKLDYCSFLQHMCALLERKVPEVLAPLIERVKSSGPF